MLLPTDIATLSISLDMNSPPTKETNICKQARLLPTVRSELNSTSKTPRVIGMQACILPTDCLIPSIEPLIPIIRHALLLPTDVIHPNITAISTISR